MSNPASKQPLVSVIIAAHNRQATIADTIASVTNSTYGNVEIIVVDDGSTDATPSIVEALPDTRIHLLRKEWGGVASAYSTGLRRARGDYVAYLDSDDIWHPSKLEKQVAFAERNPELAFIYTFVRMIDADDRVLYDVPEQRFPKWALCRSAYEHLTGANSSALMRRAALIEADKDTEGLQARQDLMLQLSLFARHPIGFVPEYLLGYRCSPGSLSSNPEAMLKSWKLVAPRATAILPPFARRVRRWANARQYRELAEGMVWQRRYAAAAKLGALACWCDPVATSVFFLHGLERLATRERRRGGPQVEGLDFADCDPPLRVCERKIFTGVTGKLADALDRARLRTIAAFDQRIAQERSRA